MAPRDQYTEARRLRRHRAPVGRRQLRNQIRWLLPKRRRLRNQRQLRTLMLALSGTINIKLQNYKTYIITKIQNLNYGTYIEYIMKNCKTQKTKHFLSYYWYKLQKSYFTFVCKFEIFVIFVYCATEACLRLFFIYLFIFFVWRQGTKIPRRAACSGTERRWVEDSCEAK